MAAKNGRRERNNRTAGGAASATDPDIQRLIDGDDDSVGGREIDGESSNAGDASGGSERESGVSGAASEGRGDAGGIGATGSGATETGTGTGADSGGARNRSRSARGNETGAASEKTRTDRDSVSRETVKPKAPKAPKLDADIPISGSNKEIIGDVFQFVFWGISQATGLPEWELESDDALTIGENGDKWLKSLGPKRAKNVVNGLKKIGPSVAFFGSLGMALVPRVKLTIDRAKNGAIRAPQKRETSGNSANSAPDGSPPDAANSGANGAAGINARSFTAADFGEATAGYVGEDARGIVS